MRASKRQSRPTIFIYDRDSLNERHENEIEIFLTSLTTRRVKDIEENRWRLYVRIRFQSMLHYLSMSSDAHCTRSTIIDNETVGRAARHLFVTVDSRIADYIVCKQIETAISNVIGKQMKMRSKFLLIFMF